MKRTLVFSIAFFVFMSCSRKTGVVSVSEVDLFSLGYGNFEDELNVFDLAEPGKIDTYMTMHDGFFYIANGESKKMLELNSFGDLLTVYYNSDFMQNLDFAKENAENTTKKAISYPFNTLGPLAVDSHKNVYVVDTLPQDRQERDEKNRLLLANVVLRFDLNGKYVDYIGQQGPGGTPFPFIEKIYTTKTNEFVVVCRTNEGFDVFWFAQNGFLLYDIPISRASIPKIEGEEENSHFSIENVIPDLNSHKLYLKVDYYSESLDSDLNVLAGIDYAKTELFPLDVESGKYDSGIEIPGYEQVSGEETNLSAKKEETPFDFFGVTESGWFFFIVPTDLGYLVQMVQGDGQQIVKRTLDVDHSKILYHSLSLSDDGIISGLFVRRENALVSWWRTDSLLSSFSTE